MSRLLKGKQLRDLTITGAKIADATINGDDKLIDASVTPVKVDKTGTWDFTGGDVQVADTPAGDTSAVNKAYVDAVAQGLVVKESCRVATAAALPAYTPSGSGVGKTLTANANGALTVDGIAVVADDRVLIKDEGSGTSVQNGIYVVTATGDGSNPWVLTRATDFDGSPVGEVRDGNFTFIGEGTLNESSGWVLTTNDPITVDTTSLTFTQFSGAGTITAGAGLTKSGNTLNVGDANKGVQVNADDVQVDASEIASNGLAQVGGAGNEHLLTVKRDTVGGANLAGAIDVNVNGVAVRVDDVTITEGVSGQLKVGRKPKADLAQNPTATSGDGQDTSINITYAPDGGAPVVLINGIEYEVGDGVKTKEFFYSVDGGTTARTHATIAAGDSLYFNGAIAGFDLETDDVVDQDYVTLAV